MAEADAGLAAALDEALASAGGALPVRGSIADQLDLLPEGRVTREDVERLPRGRGRPPGAMNRRTAVWRDYLARRYTHPLETLAAIQSTPVDVLAAQLGCKPVEALTVIARAADALAPYMEGKQPVAVDLNIGGGMTMLVMEGVTHSTEEVGAVLDGVWLDVAADDAEMAENGRSEGDR